MFFLTSSVCVSRFYRNSPHGSACVLLAFYSYGGVFDAMSMFPYKIETRNRNSMAYTSTLILFVV